MVVPVVTVLGLKEILLNVEAVTRSVAALEAVSE